MRIDCQNQTKGAKGIRNKGWLAIALVMVSPVMLFTASCAKKVVQTQVSTPLNSDQSGNSQEVR